MSTKKVQEGSDPATPEAKAAPPATTTVQQPATNPSVPATQTTGQTTPTTGTTQGGTTAGNPTRPTRVDIPAYYPNPNGRFEVLYNQSSPKTQAAKKATFIELRALITGEGDKIQVSQTEQKSRKWTFGRLQPPVLESVPVTDSQTTQTT